MKTTIRLLIATALLAAITLLDLIPSPPIQIFAPPIHDDEVPSDDTASRIEAAQKEIRKLQESSLKENRSAVRVAESRIADILAEAQRAIPEVSARSAVPFQGFSNITNCVFLGAKDTITRGSSLSEYTAAAMQPSTALLSDTSAKLKAVIEGYDHTATSIHNRYQRDTLAVLEKHELSPHGTALPDFTALTQPLNLAIKNNRSAIVSTTIEAALIGTTYGMIKRTFAHLIARQSAAVAAGGTAVVVDGPLPIGDVIGAAIGVGGIAWTAWDIRKAVKTQKEFPRKIENALRLQIRELGDDASQAIRNRSNNALSTFASN